MLCTQATMPSFNPMQGNTAQRWAALGGECSSLSHKIVCYIVWSLLLLLRTGGLALRPQQHTPAQRQLPGCAHTSRAPEAAHNTRAHFSRGQQVGHLGADGARGGSR